MQRTGVAHLWARRPCDEQPLLELVDPHLHGGDELGKPRTLLFDIAMVGVIGADHGLIERSDGLIAHTLHDSDGADELADRILVGLVKLVAEHDVAAHLALAGGQLARDSVELLLDGLGLFEQHFDDVATALEDTPDRIHEPVECVAHLRDRRIIFLAERAHRIVDLLHHVGQLRDLDGANLFEDARHLHVDALEGLMTEVAQQLSVIEHLWQELHRSLLRLLLLGGAQHGHARELTSSLPR